MNSWPAPLTMVRGTRFADTEESVVGFVWWEVSYFCCRFDGS